MPPLPQKPFGDYLDSLLNERGLTVRQFAAMVGLDSGTISKIKRLTLNPKLIAPWADVLGLAGEQRERFVKLAWLAHAPTYVVDLVTRLEAQVSRDIPHKGRSRK